MEQLNNEQLQQRISELRQQIAIRREQIFNTINNNTTLQTQRERNIEEMQRQQDRINMLNNTIAQHQTLQTEKQAKLEQVQARALPNRTAIGSENYRNWNNLKQEIERVSKEESNLRNNFEQMENLTRAHPPANVADPEQAVKEFYDFVVDIDSMVAVLQGWPYFTAEQQNEFLEYLNQNRCTVGVIGMSNKGKSYLIGRINGMDDIPVGYDVHTRGISLVRGKNLEHLGNEYDIYDSQGLGVSLQYRQDNRVRQIIEKVQEQRNQRRIVDFLTNPDRNQQEAQVENSSEQIQEIQSTLKQDRYVIIFILNCNSSLNNFCNRF